MSARFKKCLNRFGVNITFKWIEIVFKWYTEHTRTETKIVERRREESRELCDYLGPCDQSGFFEIRSFIIASHDNLNNIARSIEWRIKKGLSKLATRGNRDAFKGDQERSGGIVDHPRIDQNEKV